MSARDDTPSIREIAELTARLRALSNAGRHGDPAEREAFLADKDALIARIPGTGDDARAAELTRWSQDSRTEAEADAAAEDDGPGWSR